MASKERCVMGVRVEKYIPEIGFVYDEYPTAESWFVSATGEMQVYLGEPDDDAAMIIAEYGSQQFIRVLKDPVPTIPLRREKEEEDK